MINKRLLIKNLLSQNDENSFYDKKLQINLSSKEGKAKFLKHICALSNSNPKNNSYIVIGVEDQQNEIVGVDFFDDSKLQNLINAYLENPPRVSYENIHFPNLAVGKVVGLVTIMPNAALTSIRKNIWKYYGGTVFVREGSISLPKTFDIKIEDNNSLLVSKIEKHAENNIQLTLDGVIDFLGGHVTFDRKSQVAEFLKKQAFDYHHISGKEGGQKMIQDNKIMGFPTHMIIDKKGTIALKGDTGLMIQEMEAYLQKL